MEQRLDPHQYELELISTLKSLENSEISKRNKRLILKFRDQCVIDGLSKPRIIKLVSTLKLIAQFLDKDFDKLTRKDIERFISYLQQKDDYSVWTKQSYKVILKKFFKWLKGNNMEYPAEVKWISVNIKKSQLMLPTQEGLITEEEVKLLIHNAENPRDKSFISLLYESGCRIGEILTLRLNNVIFDEHGVIINVTGKTGSRKVRIISSTQYLSTWIQNHPLKDDKESPLWVNIGSVRKNQAMIYPAVGKLLRTLFKKSKIKKRHNPHLFRHSRATYLANHLTEFQMNQYFGWTQGSGMPATYVHLSGRETDNALLELNGIFAEKKTKESTLKPIKCPRCDFINSYESKFCGKCAGILDVRTAMQLEEKRVKELQMRNESDQLMNRLLQDPEVQKLLMDKIAMIGIK